MSALLASRSSLLVLNLRSRAPEGSRPEREGSERKCPAEGRQQACWVGRAVQEPATSRTKPKGVECGAPRQGWFAREPSTFRKELNSGRARPAARRVPGTLPPQGHTAPSLYRVC